MSISFSGLASGLDTSAWVESLVALKRAKVETLTEEKQTVQGLQEALTSIRSFFNSFRATIEKVTDTKFGVTSLDIFSQNLAISSDVSILTASATAEAEEATYEVLVDKLASNSKAITNHTYITTIVQTTTATADSFLKDLGVTAGNIGVTVGGIEYSLNLTDNDTVSSFIGKLNSIGVEAGFNETTGVFNLNLNIGAINDIGNTGIVDALHLEGVNEGYITQNRLEIEVTDTIYSAATTGTLMSDLGVNAGTITVTDTAGNHSITITSASTVGSFVADLKANNIKADLDSMGVFTMTDAEITNEGTTNILDAFGLEADIYQKTQQTGSLKLDFTVTDTIIATEDSLLKDLEGGEGITDNSTVIVKNSNNEYHTITVGTDSTIGDLLQGIRDAGLSATIGPDGTIAIAGGTIEGGTFDAESVLGLNESVADVIVTGNFLTETVEEEELATYSTKLVEDLGVKEGYLKVTDADGNDHYEKIYSGQTISDFCADMRDLGISAELDETTGTLTLTGATFTTLTDSEVQSLVTAGKITETDANLKKGTDLLNVLYGSDTISSTYTSVNSTFSQSDPLGYTKTTTVQASSSTSLGELGLTTEGTIEFNVNGEVKTINVTSDMTIGELVENLQSQGIDASWNSDVSRLIINGCSLAGGTSNLTDALGLTSTPTGSYVNTNFVYSQTYTQGSATTSSTLEFLGIDDSMSEADRTVKLYDMDDNLLASTVVTESTSISDLINFVNGNGATATLQDGVFTINGGYIKNTTLESSMGLTITDPNSYVLGSVISVTTTVLATGSSKLSDIIAGLGTTDLVSGGYNLAYEGNTVAADPNLTLEQLIGNINIVAGSTVASLEGGRLKIATGSITGSVADALGFVPGDTTISADGNKLTFANVTANGSTTFAQLGIGDSSYVVKSKTGSVLGTVNVTSTTTIDQFFSGLNTYTISASITNGVISLNSSAKNYIVGDLPDALGIGTTTAGEEITTAINTQTSANAITYTAMVTTPSSTTYHSATSSTPIVYETVGISYTTTTTAVTQTSSEAITKAPMSVDAAKRVANVASFTSGQTYYISTTDDLVALQDLTSAGVATTGVYFELANDIDMEGVAFRGIGSSNAFKGSFDGNGYNISNLTINTTEDYAGLFGYTSAGTIQNVGVVNCNITGKECVGGLIGGGSAEITNCYTTGSVNGEKYVGGLAGLTGGSQDINNSYSECNVTSTLDSVSGTGGFIGRYTGSYACIENCYSTGDVTGGEGIGGFIGEIYCNSSPSTITSCYSTGDVTRVTSDATNNGIYIGGFVGSCKYLVITNSFATGNVSASGDYNAAGCFMGYAQNVTITSCYTSGTMDSLGNGTYGFIASTANTNLFTDNYCNENSGAYRNSTNQATPTSVENIKSICSHSAMGFTQANGWTIVDDMPELISMSGISSASTFADIGLTAAGTITLNGTSIVVNTTDTIDSVITALNNAGVSASYADGIVSIGAADDTNYVTGITSELADILNLPTSGFYDVTITPVTQTTSTTVINSATSGSAITYQSVTTTTYNPSSTMVSNSTVTGTSLVTTGQFKNSVTRVDTSGIQAVSEVETFASSATYKIETTDDLIKISNYTQTATLSGTTFILANDIDMTGIDWTPIYNSRDAGNSSSVFNGNGYIISNLTSTNGLFKEWVGEIKNLGLTSLNISCTSSNAIGGLVGELKYGTINNCFTSGTIESYSDTGGLVGQLSSTAKSFVTNCYSDVEIVHISNSNLIDHVGGLVGLVNYSNTTITNSYTSGSIDCSGGSAGMAGQTAGGLVGYFNASGAISNAYTSMSLSVSYGSYVGGILGRSKATSISNVYFDGSYDYYTTIQTNCTAAIIGYNENVNATVSNLRFNSSNLPIVKIWKKTSTSTATVTATAATTFANLGLADGQTVTFSDGSSITLGSDTTISSLVSSLSSKGVTASFNESTGKITIGDSNDSVYVSAMSSDLASKLGVTIGEGANYSTSTGTQTVIVTQTVTATLDTTMGALGLSDGQTITLSNGSVITLTTSSKISDIVSQLNAHGCVASFNSNTGKLTVNNDTSTVYVDAISNDLSSKINISTLALKAITAGVESPQTFTAASTTTLGTVGLGANATITLSNGSVITATTATTLATLASTLSGQGVTASYNATTGKFTVGNSGDSVYITNMDSSLKTLLKLSGNFATVSGGGVYTINTNSTSLLVGGSSAGKATTSTSLGSLSDDEAGRLSFGNDDLATLIIETTSTAGVVSTSTLTFGKTATIQNVFDALAAKGITASIDSNGNFSAEIENVADFNLRGSIGELLMGDSVTKDYGSGSEAGYTNVLFSESGGAMSTTSKLTDMGVTNGNILITVGGVSQTVNIDTTAIETVDDFCDLLEDYGFTTAIRSSGQLSISASGTSSLANVADGSNILDKLGLTNWNKVGGGQSGNVNCSTPSSGTSSTNGDTKLSDLTDSSGNNLGITAGSIYVTKSDGSKVILEITDDETLNSFAQKLSEYGITMSVSGNKISLTGNANSSLTTDGIAAGNASNILDVLGIGDENWNKTNKITSDKLSYVDVTTKKLDGSTKLVDLEDSAGNSLGITTGTYYVYSDGVRKTETITNSTTVDDFIATMEKYGFNVNISSDGRISLSADDNSYLASTSNPSNNSNVVDVLFGEWDSIQTYKSSPIKIVSTITQAITRDTKLADIGDGSYQDGYITVVNKGVTTNISLTPETTIGSFMDTLELYGFDAILNNGQLVITNTGDSYLQNYTGAEKASNALDILGIEKADWVNTTNYTSSGLEITKENNVEIGASRDTLLSDIGVTTGEYFIYNNGVQNVAYISEGDTVGDFLDTLKTFGINSEIVQNPDGSSTIKLIGNGNSYIAKATGTNASNIADVIFSSPTEINEYNATPKTSTVTTSKVAATEDTLLSVFNDGVLLAEGTLAVNVDGNITTINITGDDTFGTLISKLNATGVEATLADGQFIIQSGYKDFTIESAGTTSNLQATLKLVYNDDLGGFAASVNTVMQTTTTVEERTVSISNFANYDTEMSLLNITDGTLSIYRDGQKAVINIDSTQTFGDLRSAIAAKFGDVDLTFEDGIMKIFSTTDGVMVDVGSTTDTSNISAIAGFSTDGNGNVTSARELYCVNSNSFVTGTGLFRKGNVTEGTFIIGSATFEVDATTRISDIVAQINASEEANASAYWDSIDGKLVLESRSSGAALLNIEAGTSNFTDIMGFTTSTWNPDGSLASTKMNVNTQYVGSNARFAINGTYFTSTSNTITSDISRIKGLTINLKDVTKGEPVTITVERDKDTAANAIEDVINAYNELMKQVDQAIAVDGELRNESVLRMIRNQLRNMMTSSDAGTTVFKNLAAIGISTSAASANNTSTDNKSIIDLSFDREKFIQAYQADPNALKELLVGGDNNKGVFTKVEALLESALKGVTGYFDATSNSYAKQILSLDNKISRQNEMVERYKVRLENKFASMDMLIAKMQQQYTSFLGM